MLTDLTLSAVVIVVVIGAIAALVATAADRAPGRAWRQIALERRWNHEHSQTSRDARDE